MAKKLRSEIDLPTLRISVDLATSDAVFAVVRGRRRPTEVARCRLEDLGLPRSAVGPVDDAALTVPQAIVDLLEQAAEGIGESPLPPHNALWLEFPVPRGLVHVLPWERLLESLGRPLFRLPYHPVRPQKTGTQLDIAICSSSPFRADRFEPPQVLGDLARRYLDIPGRSVTVHLFAGAEWYGPTAEAVLPLGGDVVVHDPARGGGDTRRPGSLRGVANPWLTWIQEGVQGGRLDIVHFATHGSLSDGRGELTLADSPLGNDGSATFVESVELVEFLTRVGAVGLVLSSTPGNRGEAGLRELADYIARSRPGVTAVHDLEMDPAAEQFGDGLRAILAPSGRVERPLPAMTAWVHPLFAEVTPGPEAGGESLSPDLLELTSGLMLRQDGRSAFLQEATREVAIGSDAESWVASASRSIEQLQMNWLPYTTDLPVDQAAVNALTRVAGLLDQQVQLAYPVKSEEAEDAQEPTPPKDGPR